MKIFEPVAPLAGLQRYERWKAQWQVQEGLDVHAYLFDAIHPEDALLLTVLFLPRLICFEGGIFMDDRFSETSFRTWLAHCEGDLAAVEAMMNHVHLYDVFGTKADGVNEAVFERLGQALAFSWRALLAQAFPERHFSVEYSNTEQDYGPTVTFFQVATAARASPAGSGPAPEGP